MNSNGSSGWLSGIVKTQTPALMGDFQADVAIVGGGLTGLSAAYHLKKQRPKLEIIVLEAGLIGSGASGASTGMLGPGVGGSIIQLRKKFGDLTARRMYGVSVAAVEASLSLIREESLACELEHSEQLLVARTESQARALFEQSQSFQELGFELPYLDRDCLNKRLRNDVYHGGIAYKHAALVNPAALCQELARVVTEKGVKIFQMSPVTKIQAGEHALIELENGSIRARQVVVATNAFAPQLGLLEGRVTPLYTHVLLTDPLSSLQLAELGWEQREAIVEFRNLFNYFRLTPDNRILFGGGSPQLADARRTKGLPDAVHQRAIRKVERDFRRVFPSLRELPLARTWSGPMGFTLDRLPILGRLAVDSNILFAGAWCGHGLALATASGAVIAKQMTRECEERLPWIRNKAPWLPPDPLRRMGIAMYLGLLELSDRFAEWSQSTASRSVETVKQ